MRSQSTTKVEENPERAAAAADDDDAPAAGRTGVAVARWRVAGEKTWIPFHFTFTTA
jgi:hypothetical protein